MVKKYNDIIIFIDNYCYQPIEIESTSDESSDNEKLYWYYCKETNVKLVPNFFGPLARHFFHSNELYNKTLNSICNNRGVNEGDKIIDKRSGYIITNIAFDESEGYDEKGFKQVTRSVMDNNIVFKDTSIKYISKTGTVIKKY